MVWGSRSELLGLAIFCIVERLRGSSAAPYPALTNLKSSWLEENLSISHPFSSSVRSSHPCMLPTYGMKRVQGPRRWTHAALSQPHKAHSTLRVCARASKRTSMSVLPTLNYRTSIMPKSPHFPKQKGQPSLIPEPPAPAPAPTNPFFPHKTNPPQNPLPSLYLLTQEPEPSHQAASHQLDPRIFRANN